MMQVTLVVSSAQQVKPSDKITHKVFQVPYEAGTTAESVAKALMEKGTASWEVFRKTDEMRRVMCESLLNNTDFLNGVRGFDLLVHDTGASCSVLLAEYLGIPRVELLLGPPNTPFGMYHMTPMPVSYIPQILPGYSDKMSFLQRVVNLGSYTVSRFFMALLSRTMNDIKFKYNIKPERSFQEAAGDAELVLITADFALEYPQPLLPGIDYCIFQ